MYGDVSISWCGCVGVYRYGYVCVWGGVRVKMVWAVKKVFGEGVYLALYGDDSGMERYEGE